MKFFLKTYGCKVNQYETQCIREQLVSAGFSETDSMEQADLCIVNTCTVTAKADRGCRDILRRIARRNQKTEIIATGCYVEADSDAIRSIDSRIKVIGNKDKPMLVRTFHKNADKALQDADSRGFNITYLKDRSRAFIKVQDGCNNFCSYCIVPLVRGRSYSRPLKDIVDEAGLVLKNGYKELVLTGICLGDFGKDLGSGTDITSLVQRISGLDGDFRIRLSSIELADISEGLIDEMKASSKLCNHLHIPLQSGDSDILKKMNRRYTADDFISRIEYIRSNIPDLGFTTDIIVGFPGETESNFQNTLETVKKIRPSRTHIFTYNPRPGTRAAGTKPIVEEEHKRQRYNRLKQITDRFSQDFEKGLAGHAQRVLVESVKDKATGLLGGYTDTYVKVFIPGPDELMNCFIYHTI
jgi:threonylcarbamoyladenosine tRNA methylthiotransferase MtaB